MVVEDLADHITAVKDRFGQDPYNRRRRWGQRLARGRIKKPRTVAMLPGPNAVENARRQRGCDFASGRNRHIGKGHAAAIDSNRGRRPGDAGAAFDVKEPGRQAVYEVGRPDDKGVFVGHGDRIGNDASPLDDHPWRGLGDRQAGGCRRGLEVQNRRVINHVAVGIIAVVGHIADRIGIARYAVGDHRGAGGGDGVLQTSGIHHFERDLETGGVGRGLSDLQCAVCRAVACRHEFRPDGQVLGPALKVGQSVLDRDAGQHGVAGILDRDGVDHRVSDIVAAIAVINEFLRLGCLDPRQRGLHDRLDRRVAEFGKKLATDLVLDLVDPGGLVGRQGDDPRGRVERDARILVQNGDRHGVERRGLPVQQVAIEDRGGVAAVDGEGGEDLGDGLDGAGDGHHGVFVGNRFLVGAVAASHSGGVDHLDIGDVVGGHGIGGAVGGGIDVRAVPGGSWVHHRDGGPGQHEPVQIIGQGHVKERDVAGVRDLEGVGDDLADLGPVEKVAVVTGLDQRDARFLCNRHQGGVVVPRGGAGGILDRWAGGWVACRTGAVLDLACGQVIESQRVGRSECRVVHSLRHKSGDRVAVDDDAGQAIGQVDICQSDVAGILDPEGIGNHVPHLRRGLQRAGGRGLDQRDRGFPGQGHDGGRVLGIGAAAVIGHVVARRRRSGRGGEVRDLPGVDVVLGQRIGRGKGRGVDGTRKQGWDRVADQHQTVERVGHGDIAERHVARIRDREIVGDDIAESRR